jgi:hypothetical protein
VLKIIRPSLKIAKMSCNCSSDLSAPTLIDFKQLQAFQATASDRVRSQLSNPGAEPEPESIVAVDGTASIMFSEGNQRFISVLDDGANGIVTKVEVSDDESLITVSLLMSSGDFSSLLSLDVVSTSAGYALREADTGDRTPESYKDCAKCILEKCGDCNDCAVLIPVWKAVAVCLTACAGVCAYKRCYRQCH